MASELLFELLAFTNPHDPAQLRQLDVAVANALAAGLSPSDKKALLEVFERFPEEDGFGVFWSILHALEFADDYEQELVASLRRVPNLFNTLMVMRIVNAGGSSVADIPAKQLFNEVIQDAAVIPSVIEQVQRFLHGMNASEPR